MIVDDRPENLLSLEAILEAPDREIVRANSGNEALSLMLKHDFALVLLDVQMPGMDGFETAQLMRGLEKTRGVPIIFVSAINKEQTFVFRGYEAGAVDYLFKPIEPHILQGKVNVFLDLYRQREAKKQLLAELERSNQELQDFAHMTSHDLKAPLRSVRFSLQMLREDFEPVLNEEGVEYLDTMDRSVKRMQTLIDDLLDYAKAANSPTAFETLPLNRIIEDVLVDLHGQIQETGATVASDDLPNVRGDGTQLTRLFQNLIGNALKYRRPDEKPHITLKTEHCDDSRCTVVVTDNGMGFDNQHAERIFLPFQRLVPKGKLEGSGIGLAICKKIVNHHGGTINASGEIGIGATFRVTLRRHQ
nr:ATP-binding protein [Acanthopleuribacter pedis]